MSTDVRNDRSANRSRDERLGIAGLLGLLVLSVIWPTPVLWLNDLTVGTELRIDHESFLGREAPEWDVTFWWIAGMFGLFVAARDVRAAGDGVRRLRFEIGRLPVAVTDRLREIGSVRIAASVSAVVVATAFAVIVIDPLVLDWLIVLDQTEILEWTSLINRFGGGVAPALVAVFIGLVGVSRADERWIRLFVAIVSASAVGAMLLHATKLLGRVRPELFRELIELDPAAGASFPSGHTLSAFLVAGAIAVVSRSRLVSVNLLGLACVVGAARVMTFRHWPSDVIFSAILGLLLSRFFLGVLNAEESAPCQE